ncbi:MAG: DEAD/DEAH box helicase [Sandaracinaceae bacterium]|nr:DEAD/DEAH box helicase [Sandaracinaceae bacterium]
MSASLSLPEPDATTADTTTAPDAGGFAALGLAPALVDAVTAKGYTAPTEIQAQAIPPLLAGRDLIGQAQTGTGKTAAFTLPLLEALDLRRREVQAIVLAPTRELALQVSDSLAGYGAELGALEAVTIYGGAAIGKQLARLRQGVHVVVGTPGRILDCMRRGALSLDAVRVAVVDEADEMLRMGFIDDVEEILAATPSSRQTALFSATMAPEIERVARQYLREPVKVNVRQATRTVANIEQHVLCVSEGRKLEALMRLIEAADHQAMLVFVRTRATCAELAEALEENGHATAALHGDMSQSQREDVLRRLRAGRVDLLIATDVAARGLDVDDITHVVNFDPPMDPDTYVHRIGRTGRAGRDGASLLMLTPRQRRIRTAIERHTRQPMTEIRVPSNADLAWARKERFKAAALRAIEEGGLEVYESVVAELIADGAAAEQVAAALAAMACRHRPLLPTGEVARTRQTPEPTAPPERGPRSPPSLRLPSLRWPLRPRPWPGA